MFKFARPVFGRKGAAPAPASVQAPATTSPPPRSSPWQGRGSSNSDLTIDWIRSRCEGMARGGRNPAGYFQREVLSGLSPEERAGLFASFASDADILNIYDRSDTRESWVRSCYRLCSDMDMQASRDHLGALLTLLFNDTGLAEYYYVAQFGAMVRLINQSIKDGGFFTSADLEQLGGFANKLREKSDKERSKTNKKTLLRKAEAIEKLAGLEVSATSLLLERCEGADNPYALGEKPEHYDFWSTLMAETVAGLHEIAADLRKGAKPSWMVDAALFADRWPQIGPIRPRFGAWKENADAKLQGFATLVSYTKRRNKQQPSFADPERVRRLPALRDRYAPTMNWRWNTPQIPALDVLADLSSPQWTALVEHLISGKVAPRPTVAWLKQAVKLADVIGTSDVAAQLNRWLALFHTPTLNPASLADRTNVEEMDRTVAYLNEQLPEWPALIVPEQMAHAGRALAMVAGCQGKDVLVWPFSVSLMECKDDIWEGKSPSEGKLRIYCAASKLHNKPSYGEDPASWLQVSIENEALLRGTMWLAAEISESSEAIALLETMALACAGRTWIGDQGHRSRVVANAAIATLIDKGGADVDAAVFRLSRAIPDRTINMPLFKALNQETVD